MIDSQSEPMGYRNDHGMKQLDNEPVSISHLVNKIFVSNKLIRGKFPMKRHFRSDEGLTLETPASLSLHGGNLSIINLFDP